MGLDKVKFAFVAHEAEGSTGFPAAFASYLQDKGAKLTYIKFPFAISYTKSIWIEKWIGQNLLYRRRSVIRFFKPQLVSFVKDFMWLMTIGWPYLIGAEFVLVTNNLLGLAALMLRKLGLIKRFSYLVVDYSPRRFSQGWVESIYIYLDRLIATKADSVWTMNLEMLAGRERDGRFRLDEVKYRIAPMGNYAHLTFANGEPPFDSRRLIFIGNPTAKNVRADLLLEAAAELLKRNVQFKLIFVGPGSPAQLIDQARAFGLEEYVEFKGSIADAIELERFMAGCGIGLAPYDPNVTGNFSNFADSAKIKTYLGCSLPVVTTAVPPIAKDLEAKGAGLVADFSATDFATKIQQLWSDDKKYRQARDAALKMGIEFSWPRIFDRLVREEGLNDN